MPIILYLGDAFSVVVGHGKHYARKTEHDVPNDFPTYDGGLRGLTDPVGDAHEDDSAEINGCTVSGLSISVELQNRN